MVIVQRYREDSLEVAVELAGHAIDNLPGNVYLGPGTVVVVPEMEEVPEIGKYRALVDINEISKGMEMVERGISGLREVAGSPAKG